MRIFFELLRLRFIVRSREAGFLITSFVLPSLLLLVLKHGFYVKSEYIISLSTVVLLTVICVQGGLTNIVSDKCRKILKLMKILPRSSPALYILSEIFVTTLYIVFSLSLLIVITLYIANIRLKVYDISFITLITVLASFSTLSLMLLFASFMRNEKMANAIGSIMASSLPMITAFSITDPSLKNYVIYLPTSSYFYIVKGILMGQSIPLTNLIILLAWIIMIVPIIKIFTWD